MPLLDVRGRDGAVWVGLRTGFAVYAVACSACSNSPSDKAVDSGGVTPVAETGSSPDVVTLPPAPFDAGTIVIVPGADTFVPVAPLDGGPSRSYTLHVPTGYTGAPTPLILNFHGYGSTGPQQAAFSEMSPKADAAGYIVAYPEGEANSWNAGTCCGAALNDNIDDVGYTRQVVADISARVHVDARRVYVTGMSNGGFMSHRLACNAADLFAAFAPVAGVLGIPAAQCVPARPISMIEFHGTADPLVSYDGGRSTSNLVSDPVPDTFAGWANRNGCTDTPAVTYDSGAAHCATYSACSAGVKVTLCTIDGEGHCWPGQPSCPYGAASTDIDADDAMWAFFQNFALPSDGGAGDGAAGDGGGVPGDAMPAEASVTLDGGTD